MWTSSVRELLVVVTLIAVTGGQFAIDYERNTFTMDGQPFRYISGSLHYFRSPAAYWRDRLRTLREAGLNVVSTYVEWSLHEKNPGRYNFDGEMNITNFIQIAREEGLYVILRPGPYICAERDMGGLPFWLMQKNPDVQLRTSDPKYTKYVQRWMDVLFTEVKPLLYGNGGPIILVQVENEYGSYSVCDKPHLIWLRDLFNKHIENKAVLFTTDGGFSTTYLKCGKIPGVYATVDFGPEINVTTAFNVQRAFEPQGPLINSEYYPGWLTHWGEPRAKIDTQPIIDTLRLQHQAGANINFYMFHGGTNFGFTAGANFDSAYRPDITSYDYDAPMTEDGDITPKYQAIQQAISELTSTNIMKRRNRKIPAGDYGELTLTPIASLLSPRIRQTLGKAFQDENPLSFEALGQNSGYLLYETILSSPAKRQFANLNISQLNDRGLVMVNGIKRGLLDRETKVNAVNISVAEGDNLGILTENLGRINYGRYLNDQKGILSNVTLSGSVIKGWKMTGFSLEDISPVLECSNGEGDCINGKNFIFYSTKFIVPDNIIGGEFLPDTYMNVTTLTKGLVFVNGINLGRYWVKRGPQLSLYVPGVYLNKPPVENVIVIFDENINASNISVKLSPTPIWNNKVKIHKG